MCRSLCVFFFIRHCQTNAQQTTIDWHHPSLSHHNHRYTYNEDMDIHMGLTGREVRLSFIISPTTDTQLITTIASLRSVHTPPPFKSTFHTLLYPTPWDQPQPWSVKSTEQRCNSKQKTFTSKFPPTFPFSSSFNAAFVRRLV
jgi:hypothetical protein